MPHHLCFNSSSGLYRPPFRAHIPPERALNNVSSIGFASSTAGVRAPQHRGANVKMRIAPRNEALPYRIRAEGLVRRQVGKSDRSRKAKFESRYVRVQWGALFERRASQSAGDGRALTSASGETTSSSPWEARMPLTHWQRTLAPTAIASLGASDNWRRLLSGCASCTRRHARGIPVESRRVAWRAALARDRCARRFRQRWMGAVSIAQR